MKLYHQIPLILGSLVTLSNCGRDSDITLKLINPNAVVHVDIESSVQSMFIGQQHFEVPITQLFGEGLKLKPLVTLKGSVLGSDSKKDAALDSDIVAFTHFKGPLKNRSYLSANLDNQRQFSLVLVAGQSYTVVVNPQGAALRAPAFFEVNIEADTSRSFTLPAQGTKVHGKIRVNAPSSVLSVSDKLWIRVMQDNRQVSSLGRLSETGEFTVFLSRPLYHEDVAAYPLELVIEHTSELNFLSTKRIILPKITEIEELALSPIDLGPSKPLIEAQVLITGTDGMPVRDARLIVRSLVEDGFIQSTTMSDANGLAQVLIPVGKYDVAIVPKHDDIVGSKKMKDVVFENSSPLNIRLDKRSELKVRISDGKKTPISGAQVLLSRFAKANSNARENILENAELRLEARSNAQGELSAPLLLDSGRYRITVIPPEGSFYPYFTKVLDFPESSFIEVSLEKAVAMTGKLLSQNKDVAVPRSFIRIFAPEIEKETGIPIFISQAFSQKDGTFSVIIPPEFAFSPLIKAY